MIAILHLTDMHFTDDTVNVQERASAVSSALCTHSTGITDFVIIHTGDVGCKGRSIEYEKGCEFFEELFSSIHKWRASAMITTIVIPGNHDCDFSQKMPIREVLLQSENPNLGSVEIIQEFLKPQNNFFDFTSGDLIKMKTAPFIWKRIIHSISGKRIAFECYNTAWGFQLGQKPGTLKFPCDLVEKLHGDTADFVFSMLHHPLAWFEPENYLQLRSKLEEHSDIIFLGHEHRDDRRKVYNREDLGTEYIHGAALYPHDGGKSGFNLLHVDLVARSFKHSSFFWNDLRKVYIPSDDFDSLPYRDISNKCELHSTFRIIPSALQILNFRVQMLQFYSGVLGGELPIHFLGSVVPVGCPIHYLAPHGVEVGNSTVQALAA